MSLMLEQPGPAATASDLQSRARGILGLNDLERWPHALPIRVERMWREESFAPHVAYTGAILVPMDSRPDLGLWRDAIAAVTERHEALRSRLAVTAGRAVMVAAPPAGHLEMTDISASDMAGYRDKSRASAVTEFFAAPIDLFAEAGFRAHLFRDPAGQATLGILMHHYFGDAWSSQILRQHLHTAHAALRQGTAPDWKPVAQYSDYALDQRRALADGLPAQLDYWHRHLAGARPTDLPFDRQGNGDRLGRMAFPVSAETLAKLTQFSRERRVSLPMICLGAFQLALAGWCGQRQAVTAVTSADRLKPRFRDTIGRLMAGLPLCSDFSHDRPLSLFLSALAKDFYDAIAHRDLAFEQYDEIFAPAPPFCTARFNFIPAQAEFSTGGDGGARPEISGIVKLSDVAKAATYRDLHFLVMQYPDGLVGRVIHSLNFSSEKIQALIGAFERVLQKIAGEPDARLSELL